MGYLLFTVAVAMLISLSPVGFTASQIIDWKNANARLEFAAYIIDILANVLFGPLLNLIMITPRAKRRFGRLWKWETMSEILGYALIQDKGELFPIGKLTSYLLHRLDPFHCRKAAKVVIIVEPRTWWQTTLAFAEVFIIIGAIGYTLAFPFTYFF